MAAFLVSWSITSTPLAKQSHFAKRNARLYVSCDKSQTEISHENFDRRNLLLGMGGLYGSSNLLSISPAFATPIEAPDFTQCSRGTNLNTGQPLDVNCCPPLSMEIIDYKLPQVKKMRFRPAAHLATKEYIAKFEKAVELMKSLPADDPRNFMQQANVHCAYCNLTYEQVGDKDLRIQIHNCWHFFPWHRWYLYFYERILGKLIDDPTFGLPFWNWDNPEGMVMPDMFANSNSPLYDARRNLNHLPPAIADLAYSGKDAKHPSKIIRHNLSLMYREMIRHARHLEDFYGAKYSTGSKPNPGPGTVERGSHTAMHSWVGEATRTGEDMGNFYSAGRDTLFFGHHANVDRLWTVWQDLRGSKAKHFTDSDWLNTTFLFYDENARLVRVKVGDTMDNIKMGYDFQKVDIPWQKNRPKAHVKKSKVASTSGAPSADRVFPLKLDKVVKILVPRPKKSRSKKDKENEEELLAIEGIDVDTATFSLSFLLLKKHHIQPDTIDSLDNSGISAYHHGGPYDATLYARNNTSNSPLAALKDSNAEALKATPREKIIDSVQRHRPLDGVATYAPGDYDRNGRLYTYEEGENLMTDSNAGGGAYKRWPGVQYHPDDIKGKGEPSYSIEKALKEHNIQDEKVGSEGIEMKTQQPHHRSGSGAISHSREPSGGNAIASTGWDDGEGQMKRSSSISKRLSGGLKKRFGSIKKNHNNTKDGE